jgi:hypothetical protein
MPITYETAEILQEKLHDLNPNLSVSYQATKKVVVASIREWELQGEAFKTLAEITQGHTVKLGRSADKFRMNIF